MGESKWQQGPSVSDEPTEKLKPAPSTGRSKPYHHGNLRAALIEAAIEIIGEEGGIGFQLRAVARRAGVSPAAPYRHFRDKADLLNSVADDVANRFLQVTEFEVAKAGEAPLAQMQAQGVAFMKFAVSHPAHFRVMNQPSIAQGFDDRLQALTGGKNLLDEAIVASGAAGKLLNENPAMVNLAARSMIAGLAHLLVSQNQRETLPTVEEAEELALAMTNMLGLGIIPR